MKFTDGYWLTREGFTVERPAEAYDVQDLGGGLQILAPTRPIRTITVSSGFITTQALTSDSVWAAACAPSGRLNPNASPPTAAELTRT